MRRAKWPPALAAAEPPGHSLAAVGPKGWARGEPERVLAVSRRVPRERLQRPHPGCPREATRRTSPRGPAPRRFQHRAPSPRPGDSAGVSRRAGRRGPGPLRDQRNTSLLTVARPRVQGPVPGERGPEVGWGRAQAQEVWPLLETTAYERRRQDPGRRVGRRPSREGDVVGTPRRNAAHRPDRTLGPPRCVTGPARQRSPQGAKGPAGWGVRRPPHSRAPEGAASPGE